MVREYHVECDMRYDELEKKYNKLVKTITEMLQLRHEVNQRGYADPIEISKGGAQLDALTKQIKFKPKE